MPVINLDPWQGRLTGFENFSGGLKEVITLSTVISLPVNGFLFYLFKQVEHKTPGP